MTAGATTPLDPVLTPPAEVQVSVDDSASTATLTWSAYEGEAPFAEYRVLRNVADRISVDTLAVLSSKDLRAVEREIVNLVQAIKTAGISDSLSAELDRCERRKAELTHQHKELDQTKPESDRLPTDAEIRSALKGFRCLLESGTPQERRTVIEENIEQIVVRPSGDVLLQVNPNGLLPNRPFDWCREPDSNRHGL